MSMIVIFADVDYRKPLPGGTGFQLSLCWQAMALPHTGRFNIRHVPLQSGNSVGRVDRGCRAAASGQSAGHDRALAVAARPGCRAEPQLSGLSAGVRRTTEDGETGPRRAG